MHWTKRVSGVSVVLLGAAGIVVCLSSVVAVWRVQQRLDDTVAKTFEYVDVAFARLEERAQSINGRIGGVQDSLHELNDRVQQRVAELRGVPQEEAADIDQIERQLYARIQHVAAWIGFMRGTVDLVEQLLEMMESTSMFLQDDSRTTGELVAALRSGHDEVTRAAKLYEDVQQGLIEIRARRNIEENARRITTLSSRIDGSLGKIKGFGERFEAGVTQVRADATDLGIRIRWRLTVIAVVITLVLVWMALGQVCLFTRGTRLCRRDDVASQ